MIVDGSTLRSGIEKEHDLCVVGSGVAGMLLVTEAASDILAAPVTSGRAGP
jgi:hypothetical protein